MVGGRTRYAESADNGHSRRGLAVPGDTGGKHEELQGIMPIAELGTRPGSRRNLFGKLGGHRPCQELSFDRNRAHRQDLFKF